MESQAAFSIEKLWLNLAKIQKDFKNLCSQNTVIFCNKLVRHVGPHEPSVLNSTHVVWTGVFPLKYSIKTYIAFEGQLNADYESFYDTRITHETEPYFISVL